MYNAIDLGNKIDEGMQYLTKEEKRVLVMLYYESMRLAEVAKAMDIDITKCEMLRVNAMTKMRKFTPIFDEIESVIRVY